MRPKLVNLAVVLSLILSLIVPAVPVSAAAAPTPTPTAPPSPTPTPTPAPKSTTALSRSALVSIAITPSAPSTPVGLTRQFTATGIYSDNSTAVLTTNVTWASSNATVASIGNTGLATAVSVGMTLITATLGAVTASTAFTVTAPLLVFIGVTPINPVVTLGQTQQFTATGTYSDASTANLTAVVAWTSSNVSVATINASGLAQSIGGGVATITATLVGLTGSTLLTVGVPTGGGGGGGGGGGPAGIPFVSDRDGNLEIYIMGVNGENQTRVTNNPAYDNMPALSRQGRLAFTSDREGNREIYLNDNVTRVLVPANLEWACNTGVTLASGQPFLVHASGNWTSGVWTGGPDGRGDIPGGDMILPTASAYGLIGKIGAGPPFFVGSNYVGTSNATGLLYLGMNDVPGNFWDNSDSLTADIITAGQARLTNNPARDEWPAWSPDGTRIAFTSHRDGNPEIYVMNSDGTAQERLTTNPGADSFPAWSPDGTRMAFASDRGGNMDVYVMSSNGTAVQRLTTSVDSDSQPTWSPDGARIAFTSTRNGDHEVYVMSANGNNQTRLTNTLASDAHPLWSPDGTKIFFTSTRDGYFQVYAINPDGTGQTRLSTPYNDWVRGRWIAPTVSTDGTSNVTSSSARLAGSLTALGSAPSVNAYFEWGLTAGNYTGSNPWIPMIAAGAFSFDLTGLSSNTTYHFRARADADGGGWGNEGTFTTLSGGGGRISGRVLRSDNVTPVAEASVSIVEYPSLSGIWVSHQAVQTGSDGYYQTGSLPAGQYALRANATGYATEWYANSYTYLGAVPVSVIASTIALDVNFTLEPGGTISGTIRNADGSATLGTVSVEARRTVDVGPRDWVTATADGGGNYLIQGLPYGDYRVRSPGGGRWAANDGNLVTEYYSNRTNEKEADLAAVSSNVSPTGVNFTLATGGSVSGRVLQSDNVTPIAYVNVSASDYVTGMWESGTDTDSQGYYTMRGLPAGSHRIRAIPYNNGLNYVSKWYNNAQVISLATPVPVATGIDTPGINFSLERGGSISGRVTLAEGGVPVGGARILAQSVLPDSYVVTAYTLADGGYTLVGLAAGQYRVSASAAGYVLEYYNNTNYYNDATLINVTTGGITPNVDFSLDRGGSISGFVYRTDGTTPVAATLVIADSGSYSGMAAAAPDGSYTVPGLPTGQYRVHTYAPGGYITEYYNNVPDYSRASLVNVIAPANTPNISFTLDAGGSISGRVLRSSDNGTIQNASVAAYLVGGDTYAMRLPAAPGSPLKMPVSYESLSAPSGDPSAAQVERSRTRAYQMNVTAPSASAVELAAQTLNESTSRATVSADGTYRVTGLPTGQYRVRASAPGYVSEYYLNVYDYNSATLLNVTAPNAITNIDFILDAGGSISGRVLQSDNVTPVPYAYMLAVDSDSGESLAGANADSQGYYSLGGLHASNYLVRAQPPDGSGLITKWYDNAVMQNEATAVPVNPPADTPNIDFRLEMGASISGRVFRMDGTTPVASAWVNAWLMAGNYGRSAQVSAEGTYNIRGLAAGQYRVSASATGYVNEFFNNVTDYNLAAPVTVAPPSDTPNINFTLDVGGSISGRILQSDNATPTAGAWAQAYSVTGNYGSSAPTAPDGTYTIMGLPAGQYRVCAGAEGYITEYYNGTYQSTNATLVGVTVPNNTPGIDFTLDLGSSISGRVTKTAGGAPVAGASIDAYGNEYGRGARTNTDGTYTVSGLPTGQYRVHVYAAGYIREYYNNVYQWSSATTVNVTAPQTTPNINFSLEAGGSITGRVTTLHGGVPAPVAGVYLYAVDNATGEWMSSATTRSDGYYELSGLLTGTYRVRASPSSNRLPYIDEFYNDRYSYEWADPVSVTLPNTTPGIDFVLEPQVVRQIPAALMDGIAWLASQQHPDGSWGTNNLLAKTALSVLKLSEFAREQGKSPLAATYPYHDNVTAGLNYIFAHTGIVQIGPQSAGNPDGNGNGIGVFFDLADPTLGLRPLYNSSIALMAIAATGEPSGVVSVAGSAVNGRTFAQVAQDTVDYLAWAQTDSGYGRGGWSGWPVSNGGPRSDQSDSGWAALALAAAEAPVPSGMGIAVPGFVRSELNIWIDYIQNDVNGDPQDGGADYEGPGSPASMWVNALNTGFLLQQMAFVGDTPFSPRVQAAVAYLARHWGEGYDPGWRGNPSCYQSTYTIMKGLEALGIDTIGPVDWFQDFIAALLHEQSGAGFFPPSRWDDGERILSTTWALLTLEKAIPPTHEGPDLVVSGKNETWVNEASGTYRVQFTVRNQGNMPAPAGFMVSLTVDSVTFEERTVPIALAPGVTFSDNFTTVVTMSGSYDIVSVTADAGSAVPELSETNNILTNVWSSAPGPQPGPAQAHRALPATVSRSQTFDVRLTFVAPGNGFNSTGISDFAPQGWSVAVDPQRTTPTANWGQTGNNRADYIWFGPYVQGTQFTAIYQVTVPATAPLGAYSFGSGRLEYYLGGSGPFTETVTGDTLVTVTQGAEVDGVTYEARGTVLPGVTLILDGSTAVMSNVNGDYALAVSSPGTHTIVATKPGYRSQTRTFNVSDPSATYVLNFKGIYGLVPNAVDMSYVLACINKWKFPPDAELGLTLSKVLAVINAWKFPVPTPTPPTTVPPTTTAPPPTTTAPPTATPTATPTPTTPPAQRIRFSTSDSTAEYNSLYKPVLDEIAANSQGRLWFEVYTGGVLATSSEQYNLVSGGWVQMGTSSLSLLPTRFPLSAALTFPGAYASTNASQDAAGATGQRMLLTETSSTKALAFFQSQPIYLYTKSRQVSTLGDMAGLNIRTGSSLATSAVQALGAVPISLASAELYLALQTGVIDGALLTPSDMISYRIYEVTRYALRMPLGYQARIMNFNTATWTNLPADLKAVIEAASSKVGHNVAGAFAADDAQVSQLLLQSGGGTINLTTQEETRWIDTLRPVVAQWVTTTTALGQPAQQTIDAAREECQARGVPFPY